MITGFFTLFFFTIVVGTIIVGIGYLILGIADNHEAVKRGYLSTGHENQCKLEAEANSVFMLAYTDALARLKANGEIAADWNGPMPARCALLLATDEFPMDETQWDHTREETLLYDAMVTAFMAYAADKQRTNLNELRGGETA